MAGVRNRLLNLSSDVPLTRGAELRQTEQLEERQDGRECAALFGCGIAHSRNWDG
jgi:hypothetical protein